jgi:hypothetical protein
LRVAQAKEHIDTELSILIDDPMRTYYGHCDGLRESGQASRIFSELLHISSGLSLILTSLCSEAPR